MMKIHSFGKINLFLDIEGLLPNGYHLIKTVMQSVDLHDELFIETASGGSITIECSNNSIPVNEKNTCYRAAEIIKEMYHINCGVNIRINKAIPSEAGMAGGSSNGAAVIRGLNELWKLNMTENDIMNVGLKIGADVPFCLAGGTMLAEGIGERLTKLNDFIWDYILVVKPEFSMSTAFVYKNLSPVYYNSFDINEIIGHIDSLRYRDAALSAKNTLEKVVEKFHPQIQSIKELMFKKGAINSIMTGSGSAVFGFFADRKDIERACSEISAIYPQTFITKTKVGGIQLFV